MELMSLKQIADQYGHTYKAVHSFAKYYNIKPAEKRRIEGADRPVHFYDPAPFAEHYGSQSIDIPEELLDDQDEPICADGLESVTFEFPPLTEISLDMIKALCEIFSDQEVRNIVINHYGVDPYENI